MNDLYSRFDSSSSPIARITKNSITPMIRYTNRIDGPARLMVLPEPMNRPVPIAPADRDQLQVAVGQAALQVVGLGGRIGHERRPSRGISLQT